MNPIQTTGKLITGVILCCGLVLAALLAWRGGLRSGVGAPDWALSIRLLCLTVLGVLVQRWAQDKAQFRVLSMVVSSLTALCSMSLLAFILASIWKEVQ